MEDKLKTKPLSGVELTDDDADILNKLSKRELAVLRTSGTYAERAEALGIVSIGTLRSRLNRARTKLVKLRDERPW